MLYNGCYLPHLNLLQARTGNTILPISRLAVTYTYYQVETLTSCLKEADDILLLSMGFGNHSTVDLIREIKHRRRHYGINILNAPRPFC